MNDKNNGLSERDVERLAKATRDALHHWDAEATVSPPEAVARTVAPVVSAIRDEALAPIRALADEWDEHSDQLYDEARHVQGLGFMVLRSKSGTYAANAERLRALLDGSNKHGDN